MNKAKLDRLLDYSRLKFRVKNRMRYDDVGDYYDNTIISYDMQNPIINNAILLHEFIEYTLIKSAGIPVSMIDAFDTDENAPEQHKREYKLYSKYHRIANNVERCFIENMGMEWKSYQKAVYSEKVKILRKKTGKEAKRNNRMRVR